MRTATTVLVTTVIMTDLTSLLRLQTWLSPAFPTGAFAYSHGLEQAVAQKLVSNRDELQTWLTDLLTTGPGWNDAIILAEAWRRAYKGNAVSEIAELSEAMSFSKERHLETMAQGEAFLTAAKAWCEPQSIGLTGRAPMPVAVGAIAALNSVALEQTLAAYLHAYVSNQIQAALRLISLGQQNGVEVLASLELIIIDIVTRAASSSPDDLGSSTFMADIVSMNHETQKSRIFRS